MIRRQNKNRLCGSLFFYWFSRITPFLMAALCGGVSRHFLRSDDRDPLFSQFFRECALLCEAHRASFLSLQPVLSPAQQAEIALEALDTIWDSWAQTEENTDLAALYSRERQFALSHRMKVCAVETPPRLLPPLALSSCKGYIRDTLSAVGETLVRGRRVPVGALPPGADFFRYQRRVSPNAESLPFHLVVQRRIDALGCDYRFEIAPHPVEALRRRDRDETGIGR